MIDDMIVELIDQVGLGVGAACRAVGRPRATHHRRTSPRVKPRPRARGNTTPAL